LTPYFIDILGVQYNWQFRLRKMVLVAFSLIFSTGNILNLFYTKIEFLGGFT
jgi:hypothetical protein